MNSNVIVCSIDGTICEVTKEVDYEHAKPITEMILFINKLFERGVTIYLYTSRNMIKHDITVSWLIRNNVKYHHIFYGKPVGDLYIDNLSVTPEEILRRKSEWLK
jgi:uncharacterized HAD superfamily protein